MRVSSPLILLRAPSRGSTAIRADDDGQRYLRALLAASRTSSAAVVAALEREVQRIDPGVDALLFLAPNADELVCAYAGGSRAEHFRAVRLRRDDARTLPARVATQGYRALLQPNEPGLLPTDRAALAVPFLDGTALVAVVYLSACSRGALVETERLVRAVEIASDTYVLAREREADRADATFDGLTGAVSARAFRRALHDDPIWLTRGDRTLALWFVDTDRFKNVNDEFGHRAGDEVLQAMTGLLRAHAGSVDTVVARNGGDEFCVLLRNVAKSVAIDRAGALCAAVRGHDFGLPMRVTASIGVAAFPYDARTSNELLETADAAMYYSKRQGRDRVSFALEPGRYATLP